MTQEICDRCKSVTEKGLTLITRVGSLNIYYEELFDLCNKCKDEFNKFMRQRNEPTPSANEISSSD